jgi:hypothetical protein
MKAAKALNRNQNRSLEETVLRHKLEENAFPLQTGIRSSNEIAKGSSLPAIKTSKSLEGRLMSRTLTGTDSKEPKYTDEDVRKMVDDMMKYCSALQKRVQDLEVQLIQINRNKSARHDPYSDSLVATEHRASTVRFSDMNQDLLEFEAPPRMTTSSKLRPSTENQKSLSFSGIRPFTAIANELVFDIDHKVSYLKEIFKKTDPIEARRVAATKIQGLIRRFLVRVRKLSYEAAMREWRWIRCRPVVWLLDILLANQSKLDSGFHLLTMNRVMRTLKTVYGKWTIVTRQNAPVRYSMREKAEEKIQQKRKELLTNTYNAFKSVTLGRISLKNANKERKEFIDKIRRDLSNYLKEKGLVGIVPQHEITKMLHRRVIDEFKVRKRIIIMRGIINRFKNIVLMKKLFEKRSKEFRFRKLAGKCLFVWSDYTYLCSLGLDRKRWPGPRKYEVRYNQKRVDNFARLRCEKLIFLAWKEYFHVQITVKRKYQSKLSHWISKVFHAWKGVSSHYRRLRKLTHENWTGYARLIMQKPFQGEI